MILVQKSSLPTILVDEMRKNMKKSIISQAPLLGND